MIEILLALAVISFALERAIEYVFEIEPLKYINEILFQKIKFKLYTSALAGFAVAFYSKLDIINMLLNRPDTTIIGVILTGLLLSGGSNAFSHIMSALGNLKSKTP